MNTSDADAERYIKIFTLHDKSFITRLIEDHKQAPHERKLQKELASYITQWVHGKEALEKALVATSILFGKATSDSLKQLSDAEFLSVFEGVSTAEYENVPGSNIIDLLTETGFLPSRKEAGRALKENSVSVNSDKVNAEFIAQESDLISGKYLLLQRGKKNKFIVIAK
jgi:tyrosyl-tRNA synthetase